MFLGYNSATKKSGFYYADYLKLAEGSWLTPEHARSIAEIAREETIKEVCEWLDNHTMLSEKWFIEDLKKHFKPSEL